MQSLKLGPYRGEDPSESFDDLYGVPIRRFRSVDEVELDLEKPTRYVVVADEHLLPLDFLLNPKQHERLIVGFHGAEPRSALQMPKFQFTRSFGVRAESSLYFSDSTLLLGDTINIGWMAGDPTTPLAALYSAVTRKVAESLQVDSTVLVGHSAGGYSAILIGSRVPNSRAISINGQTVVTEYEPWTVDNLRTYALTDAADNSELLPKYSERLDLRVALQGREPTSSFTYFAHVGDQASFNRMPHFPILAEALGLPPQEGGITSHGDSLVPCNWETAGASKHALPGTVIPFLALVLGEKPSIDVAHRGDPRWYR